MIHKHFSRAKLFKVIPIILLAVTAFSFLFFFLWNWLMPVIFSLPQISFWQALGLLLFSKLVFSGLGPRTHRYRISPEMREHFEKMREQRFGENSNDEKA